MASVRTVSPRLTAEFAGAQHLRGRGLLLLIADPDESATEKLAEELAAYHISSIVCGDGVDALLLAGVEQPDAVLATASLPTLSGAALTRALAAHGRIPVVVSIGNGEGVAAEEALSSGAAACVARPYRLRELLPILKAIRLDGLVEPRTLIECGGLRLDSTALEVTLHGRPVGLPMRAMRLLELLMVNADRVVTREQIHDAVWGGVPGSNTITVHIRRLRQSLGDERVNPKIILTIRGVGYRLIPPLSP